MKKGRVWLSGERAKDTGISASLKEAFPTSANPIDLRMQELIEQMKEIESRPSAPDAAD